MRGAGHRRSHRSRWSPAICSRERLRPRTACSGPSKRRYAELGSPTVGRAHWLSLGREAFITCDPGHRFLVGSVVAAVTNRRVLGLGYSLLRLRPLPRCGDHKESHALPKSPQSQSQCDDGQKTAADTLRPSLIPTNGQRKRKKMKAPTTNSKRLDPNQSDMRRLDRGLTS